MRARRAVHPHPRKEDQHIDDPAAAARTDRNAPAGRCSLLLKKSTVALATLQLQQAARHLNLRGREGSGFGDRRKAMMEDIAILTGGKAEIVEETGLKLESVKLEDLGKAKRVTNDKDNTTIVDGGGGPKAIEGRIKQLRTQIDEPGMLDYDREKVRRSAWRMAGGVAIIKLVRLPKPRAK